MATRHGIPPWKTTQICNSPSQVDYVDEDCPRCGKRWQRDFVVGVCYKPYCGRCRLIVERLEKYEKKLEAST